VNIIWKILHSRWNGVCYGEHYVEDTSEQVDSEIAVSMNCLQVNINLNFGK